VIPLVGAQDVSRVAAALLANPGVPSQSAYALVGETPSVREMIEALGGAAGRPIRYVAVTDEQWANAAKERLGPHALDHLSHLWQTFRKSEERYRTTGAIRMVTGRNPQTLEEFFRENAGFFAASSQ
jgi:nucleoside-diphosphate-sugar epimerase